ncbi:toll/interleukin-1 receptor domain-containing protein [Mesorhizobium sp. M1182]|uniref:toll/interleukin-1 receptor domain-containing protein n=1 Tax=Mesorhizobium sp. M1182 TaxID=2957067 RepID=UPI0033357C65
MSVLRLTVIWHGNFAGGGPIAEALAAHFEGAEDEPNSSGLTIPVRVRCKGADPSDSLSAPLPLMTGDDTINIVLLLFEGNLVTAFEKHWSSFANSIRAELDAHPDRTLVLPMRLGDRSAIAPFDDIQSIPTSLFLGSGLSDPRWMRRLTLTIVAHIGNYLRRLEQFEKDPATPIDETLLSRFPLFLSHAKTDALAVVNAIRDHLANNNYGVDTFIDAKDLPAGLGYEKMFTAAIRAGAVVAIRSDAYSSRPWCRWETLEGKRLLRPIVVLDLFRDAELRMNPYGGNVPALRLVDPSVSGENAQAEMDRAVLAIMTEAVRIMVWNRRVMSLEAAARAKYPGRDIRKLPRPPELVDIANIRIETASPIVVLHPGPPLPRPEEKMIRAIGGDLELCAPSDLGVPL